MPEADPPGRRVQVRIEGFPPNKLAGGNNESIKVESKDVNILSSLLETVLPY